MKPGMRAIDGDWGGGRRRRNEWRMMGERQHVIAPLAPPTSSLVPAVIMNELRRVENGARQAVLLQSDRQGGKG